LSNIPNQFEPVRLTEPDVQEEHVGGFAALEQFQQLFFVQSDGMVHAPGFQVIAQQP